MMDEVKELLLSSSCRGVPLPLPAPGRPALWGKKVGLCFLCPNRLCFTRVAASFFVLLTVFGPSTSC